MSDKKKTEEMASKFYKGTPRNPKFLVSGRVYTNLGELRDERVTTVVSSEVDFLLVCQRVDRDCGYMVVNVGDDMRVTIKVDKIEKVD